MKDKSCKQSCREQDDMCHKKELYTCNESDIMYVGTIETHGGHGEWQPMAVIRSELLFSMIMGCRGGVECPPADEEGAIPGGYWHLSPHVLSLCLSPSLSNRLSVSVSAHDSLSFLCLLTDCLRVARNPTSPPGYFSSHSADCMCDCQFTSVPKRLSVSLSLRPPHWLCVCHQVCFLWYNPFVCFLLNWLSPFFSV